MSPCAIAAEKGHERTPMPAREILNHVFTAFDAAFALVALSFSVGALELQQSLRLVRANGEVRIARTSTA